jgi:hypothetical protein
MESLNEVFHPPLVYPLLPHPPCSTPYVFHPAYFTPLVSIPLYHPPCSTPLSSFPCQESPGSDITVCIESVVLACRSASPSPGGPREEGCPTKSSYITCAAASRKGPQNPGCLLEAEPQLRDSPDTWCPQMFSGQSSWDKNRFKSPGECAGSSAGILED